MFAGQMISKSLPLLHLDDSAGKALQGMNDFHVEHLPVTAEDKYLGLVSEEILLDNNDDVLLRDLSGTFIRPFVKQNDSFLLAVKAATEMHLSVVPVISDQNELLGAISEEDLFRQLAFFTGVEEQGALIILEMERMAFSVSEINRLIESNDAFVTQLNTYTDPTSQLLIVTLRINKVEVSDIIATLQRHEYTIRYYFGEELYQNELQSNLDHLMNYLNI